jgi:diguanylate cyclase (GGDEF)-like protein/PAS domain S-box-containing protein
MRPYSEEAHSPAAEVVGMVDVAAADAAATTSEDRYVEARFELLLNNVRGGLLHNFGFASVVVFALAQSAVPAPILLGWTAAMLLGLAQRYFLLGAIKRDPKRFRMDTWLTINVVSAGYMGVLWGACGLSMFYGLSNVQAAVVMLAVAGMTAGVAANGYHKPYLIAYLFPALFPLALFFLLGEGAVHKVMAAIIILYGYILFRTGRAAAEKLRFTTDLATQNEGLAKSLSETLEERRRSEERFKIIADYSYAWEAWFDVEGRIVWTSPSVERITGYTPADFQADPMLSFDIVHPDDLERVRRAMDYAVNVPSEGDLEFRIVRKDGKPRWVAAVSNPIYDKDGRSCGTRSSIRDISVQKELEAELQALAATDSLTGTLNRRAFLEKANEEIYRSARYDKPLTVAMFDLDDFKQVNDTYGHHIGDRCIVMLADIVKSSVRQSDLFARFGGEEFVLLLPETQLAPALQLCERLRQKVAAQWIETDGDPISVTVSVGLADFQQNTTTLEEIIARADAALYTAKRNGRNQVAYGSTMSRESAPCHPASIERLRREAPPAGGLNRPATRR